MILLHTIAHRWYAFGFVGGFFWAASGERGWKRALRFWGVAATVSFIAEYLSTHTGFPYGRYDYVATTTEAHLANVPLFVPLSFCVVVWAGRSVAQAGLGARTRARRIALGALVATVIDLVIDPMTLRGRSWFLGPLYLYRADRGWFNVPWSNYAGWILVSAVILWIDELFESVGEHATMLDPIRGPTLAAGICAFFIVIALVTAHVSIALASVAVTGVLVALTFGRIRALVAAA